MLDKNFTDKQYFETFLQSVVGLTRKRSSRLFVDRLAFAYKGMFAILQNLELRWEDGPLPEDIDWITNVYRSYNALEVRPQHSDADVEKFLRDSFSF